MFNSFLDVKLEKYDRAILHFLSKFLLVILMVKIFPKIIIFFI